MTQQEFDVKSDAEFYENITLGLAVILGILGIVFVGSGFAHITENPADAIFRLIFGGGLVLVAGKMIHNRFPEIGLLYKAMIGENTNEVTDENHIG